MRIIFLSEKFYPENVGGAEMVVYRLAKELTARGHKVQIIAATADKSKAAVSEFDNLKIYRLYSNIPKICRNYLGICNFFILPKIKKIFKAEKPDIVHAQLINAQISFAVLRLAKKSGAKVFYTAHDVITFSDGKLVRFRKSAGLPKNLKYKLSPFDLFRQSKFSFNPWRNFCIRRYLKYCDKIFAVSEALKTALVENGIAKVQTIYNGVDLAEFKVG
ncbi:MAG: glycosyltransferase family 4 protein, partial [Patescibacteria group bacterium]